MKSKEIKQFVKKFKSFLLKEIGKPCGHIGKNEISLDCPVCKSWLAWEFMNWFANEMLFEPLKNKKKKR